MQDKVHHPTVSEIQQRIDSLGGEAEHYILLAPYGGLEDLHEWYSSEFQEALGRVTHIESSVLDGEVLLFDRRATLSSSRKPEDKGGLSPVPGTSIALGIFEDLHGADEPQVRIQAGEYFVVWPREIPRLFRFGTEPAIPENSEKDDEPSETFEP